MKRLIILSLFVAGAAQAAPVGPRPRTPHERIYTQAQALRAGPKHRILYLDRNGGTYHQGDDDSVRNYSKIVRGDSGTLSPWTFSEQDWQTLLACVKNVYGPFAIEVTDVQPPDDVPYLKTAVSGYPHEIGLDDNAVAGIAPLPLDCSSVVEHGVSFAFAANDSINGQPFLEDICWTVAQESGHSLGMDHELFCPDPMTYLADCGFNKTFQDFDAKCGEYTERPCSCGIDTQNSYQHLLNVLGPADRVPPSVTLDDPGEGATVMPRFTVDATASDDVRVDRVELWVDGAEVVTIAAAPFHFEAPSTLAAGSHTVEVQAVDGDENRATASVTVNLVAECTTDPDCGANGVCQGGVCIGGVGATCTGHDECASGFCYADATSGTKYCTEMCTPGASDACPAGYTCQTSGGALGKCLLAPTGGGGGCTAGGKSGGGAAGGLVVLLLGFAGLRRVRTSRR